LIDQSSNFPHKTLDDATAYLENRAVELFSQHYSKVKSIAETNDGDMQTPVWRNVGVTFCAVGEPNPVRGKDIPLDFTIPEARYIEVNFWVSLPL